MSNFLRPLGRTNIKVSALGLGTVKIGRDEGVKYPHKFTIPDDSAVKNLFSLARELGINLIDTAPAYGNSEERLGQLLSHRHEWVIVTKTGEEFINGESQFDFSPEHTRRSVERSLRRLGTDYLDMVLVHSDGNDLAIVKQHGTLDALGDLKKQGKIRAFGLSGKTVDGGIAALEYSDVAMVTSNLSYDDEQAVIDYGHQHGKGILIKKAFASGHACANDEDAIQKSLNRILNLDGVSSVIAGTINPEHLRDNVTKARQALNCLTD
ncbi:MAG: aldo/keto reductase [Alcanivoracaceae bacterium]|nr:aldo/keto reductase [Alcanivoracaceae bacterium]